MRPNGSAATRNPAGRFFCPFLACCWRGLMPSRSAGTDSLTRVSIFVWKFSPQSSGELANVGRHVTG